MEVDVLAVGNCLGVEMVGSLWWVQENNLCVVYGLVFDVGR